jgi:hypothetical protein
MSAETVGQEKINDGCTTIQIEKEGEFPCRTIIARIAEPRAASPSMSGCTLHEMVGAVPAGRNAGRSLSSLADSA